MPFSWSNAGKGAAGGAAAGSMFGPWGTGIGAIAGGIFGGFGGDNGADELQKRRDEYYRQVLGRQAPQAGPAAQSALSGFRNNQSDLIGRLEAMSRGEGPSLATETLKQGQDRTMAQQSSLAQGGRGNAALASFMAMNNTARSGQQMAGDAAAARIAEQQMAFGQLGGAINQGRQSDEANSQFNAQQTNFRDQANLEAKLRTMGYNDAAIQAILASQSGQAMQPTLGDQIMAGGAGMMSLGASQRAQSKAGMSPIAAGYPGAGGYYTPRG